jgi:hypothetical protein
MLCAIKEEECSQSDLNCCDQTLTEKDHWKESPALNYSQNREVMLRIRNRSAVKRNKQIARTINRIFGLITLTDNI